MCSKNRYPWLRGFQDFGILSEKQGLPPGIVCSHVITFVLGLPNGSYIITSRLRAEFEHQRTKHIEIDIHFVREYVASGEVRVLHVPSRFQYADIFTKGLPTALFLEFRSISTCRN
ncbi:NBS-containing resistance-like protein [Tanacetum coccineum]